MSAGAPIGRQTMEVDVVCVGFGPAMGGFLTTLSRSLVKEDGTPLVASKAVPGLPLQVLCYERADDVGFGVSGVVTKARGIRGSFPDFDPSQIPMATEVRSEKVLYLLDPIGASRRSRTLRTADRFLRLATSAARNEVHAVELPYTPGFLHKQGGLVLSIGQFIQWVSQQVMASGVIQVWPATPVAEPLIENDRVVGVRLADQGVEKNGEPTSGFLPGMDIRASLTVVGDGPFGPVGRQIDEHFGLPVGHHRKDWAVGAKMVIDLPEESPLEAGTVYHTFGYPEPEIFGFLYVHPGRIASAGIFVPSWFESPVRTTYRYLQHFIRHPYFWRFLKGGRLRSWGAKSLQESGRAGEPFLVGEGYARIGEGSGSTNVLTGSGVDEAWTTGVQLAEGVLELASSGKPFTKKNLSAAYVSRRRASWVEKEGKAAEQARVGFHAGVVRGLVGMALAGVTRGWLSMPGSVRSAQEHTPSFNKYYKNKISPAEIESLRRECLSRGVAVHDSLMERSGWPAIEFDGKLLISHQDALLVGGKVQAPSGYADHVVFLYPSLCESCQNRICVEVCSGEAITAGPGSLPQFDREKCIHCGACIWNCSQTLREDRGRTNIEFRAGAGGLHSTEN
ncbi:MAG: 4Fe-4S ferredoxin [Bryobacterales bacterium]|nr:4Fe-4S ferredoxin [Bryobacterales bacterium]